MESFEGIFEGLVEFIAVAECHGFTSAAKQLNCSTSHVSRQLNRLEKRLGVALIARTTRSVNLTQAGQQYYQRARDVLNGLQQANEALGSEQYQLTGTLRVSAAGIFAEQFLASALIEFAQQHPHLKVDISFDSKLVNFVDEGFDFAVRIGLLKDSNLIARKLVDRSMIAVASPEYIDRKGQPETPQQLKMHDCLVNNDIWNFKENGELKSIRVNARFQSNNATVLVNACKQGLGIAYLPKSNVAALLQQGLVVPLLEPFWFDEISNWIVYQNRQYLPMKARVAIDFLLDYFSDWTE